MIVSTAAAASVVSADTIVAQIMLIREAEITSKSAFCTDIVN